MFHYKRTPFNSLGNCHRSVYFLYPETSGVRLEDMDLLFGDATTTMPTPITQAERGSLIGAGSPPPSLDLRRAPGQFGAEAAIPGLEIDPPHIHMDGNGKPLPQSQRDGSRRGEGIGGWISNIVTRNKDSARTDNSSQYRPLDQDDAGSNNP